MNLESILNELRSQRTRLDRAIAALEGARRPGRPAGAGGTKRRHMNAAVRRRIGAAKKAWWAKQKRTTAGTKSKPQIVKRKPMSPAARKRLATLMKARWAERKKAA